MSGCHPFARASIIAAIGRGDALPAIATLESHWDADDQSAAVESAARL
jgi:hypothetical protein